LTSSLSVLHVLPGLGFGGTEFVVFRLARAERARGVRSEILSLKDGGVLVPEAISAGIPTRSLGSGEGMRGFGRCLWPAGKSSPPYDIIHGWLYSGNLMAGIFSKGWPGSRLIWNLMQANVSPAVNGLKTRLLMKAGARLSGRWPDRIVCNSVAAREAHAGLGYAGSKMRVIPNGVDTDNFQPNPNSRARFREIRGVSSSGLVLGHLARWDPQKDHRTLIRAVGLLIKKGVDAHLFLAGPGVSPENGLLMQWIAETGRPERFHPMGPVEDTPSFLAALDIFCLSSVGESSSYALAEAMACGVPAVVTNVGDARDVVGETGVVVPPAQPQAFCEGLLRLASLSPAARFHHGAQGRERIVHNYSFSKMVDAYQALYQSIFV
jgi:glycosyltransferase involved in cell wall biosynthesis